VASNTSGSTPKELFDDLVEELDKQVHLWYISSISFFWIFPWATAAAFILHTIH
jgi:DNA polymerase III alpha subunit (gram-positive type)